MKREFYKKLMVLLILIVGCDEVVPPQDACVLPDSPQAAQLQEQGDEGEEEPPRVCVLPERSSESNLAINLVLRDFGPEKETKLNDAVERMMIVINSEEFRQRVLNHEYEGQLTFVDNNGLTNEEVYLSLIEGVETLNGERDEEIDLDVTLYFANNSTVGYTYPNTNRIWVNDKFFTTNTLGKVAANLVHEWTHKLGYNHDFRPTARRNFSVPYAVGNIIQDMVDSL